MRYQRIYSQIWHDEKFKELTPEAQHVFLYLLTSPHSNALGLYVLPEGYACTDLKLLPEPFKELFGELLAKGLIEYDATASLLYIVGHLKHNPIENENQAKFAKKIVDTLPISPLFTRLLERLDKPFHKPLQKRLQERLQERYAKPVTVTVTVTDTDKKDKTPCAVSDEKSIAYQPVKKIKRIEFDYTQRTFQNIQSAQLQKWRQAYPALNIRTEITRAEAWASANPAKRKSNWERFLTNWFSIAQDRDRPTERPVSPNVLKPPPGKYAGIGEIVHD